MPHIIGAYATSPCPTVWDEAAEDAFYDGLFAIPGVDGLEIPFTGTLHAHDEAWLLRRLPPGWRHVVTCIPGTMPRLVGQPTFGLASDDPAGRMAALDLARQAREAVLRINDRVGAAAVMAVELHSAPALGRPGVTSSVAALAASLTELAALEWDGADLAIEHCDAFSAEHTPEKGFLSLDEELAAIALAAPSGGARLGMSINWARSVLETRQTATGRDHIARLAAVGRLSGIVFSGCSDVPDQPYGAWQDNHMPADGIVPLGLLTKAEIAVCKAVGRPAYLGVKVGARPADMAISERVRINREMMAAVLF